MYVGGACGTGWRTSGGIVASAAVLARRSKMAHHVAVILGKRTQELLPLSHTRAGFSQLLLDLSELLLLFGLRTHTHNHPR